MLSHRCAARMLAPSAARPRILPGANALSARYGAPSALLRPTLAPSVQRRTFILEPLANSFLAVHSFTGIPWWLLIPALSFVRSLVFYLPYCVFMNRRLVRRSLIAPLYTAWKVKVQLLKAEDPNAAYKKQVERINREARIGTRGIQTTYMVCNLVSTGICTAALSTAMGVRASGAAAVEPSFLTEGILWFQDLTVADPIGILPILAAASIMIRRFPRSIAELSFMLNPGPNNSSASGLGRGALVVGAFVAMQSMYAPAGSVWFLASTGVSWLLLPRLDKYIYRYLPPVPKNPWIHGSRGEKWYIEGPPTRK